MGIEDADRGNANPGYWSGNGEYGRNCQSCVPAYEMRRRGYDVIALPLSEDNSTQMAIRSDTTLTWRNPDTGRHPTLFHMHGRDATSTERRIAGRIKPGQRYAMHFGWKGKNNGHIVVVERVPTKGSPIIVVDSQKGRIWKLHEYLHGRDIDYSTLGIYRIDNLELEANAAASLMRARTP
ncbi:hypothetical protein DF200_01095 [Bifidobacterium catulorum]|uniref:Tox-PL domain-containing protein n=2 Tax=Bifidobacterium catulorum TaxID=1630173 RepID=A0A2U2MVK3_9BIFI|nr:hypothetical protein DF200_01095 [Bifidobacterium catulorum]